MGNAGSIGRGDAGSGKDGDAALGSGLQGTERGDALLGIGTAAGGEDAVATRGDDLFQRKEGVTLDLVESTMEGDLHGGRKLDHLTGADGIDKAVRSEETDHDGMGSEGATELYIAAKLLELGGGVAEVALARTHQNVGAEVEGVETIIDVLSRRGEATHIEPTTELYALGSASKGVGSRLARIGTNLYNHGYQKLNVVFFMRSRKETFSWTILSMVWSKSCSAEGSMRTVMGR